MGKKTTVWTFKATNKRYLTQENLDMAKNWNLNRETETRHKDQLYQTGDISTRDGTSLKLLDKFTYLRSSVSSTKKDIDTRLTKAWTAIDRLSIIWKLDLTD